MLISEKGQSIFYSTIYLLNNPLCGKIGEAEAVDDLESKVCKRMTVFASCRYGIARTNIITSNFSKIPGSKILIL